MLKAVPHYGTVEHAVLHFAMQGRIPTWPMLHRYLQTAQLTSPHAPKAPVGEWCIKVLETMVEMAKSGHTRYCDHKTPELGSAEPAKVLLKRLRKMAPARARLMPGVDELRRSLRAITIVDDEEEIEKATQTQRRAEFRNENADEENKEQIAEEGEEEEEREECEYCGNLQGFDMDMGQHDEDHMEWRKRPRETWGSTGGNDDMDTDWALEGGQYAAILDLSSAIAATMIGCRPGELLRYRGRGLPWKRVKLAWEPFSMHELENDTDVVAIGKLGSWLVEFSSDPEIRAEELGNC